MARSHRWSQTKFHCFFRRGHIKNNYYVMYNSIYYRDDSGLFVISSIIHELFTSNCFVSQCIKLFASFIVSIFEGNVRFQLGQVKGGSGHIGIKFLNVASIPEVKVTQSFSFHFALPSCRPHCSQ